VLTEFSQARLLCYASVPASGCWCLAMPASSLNPGSGATVAAYELLFVRVAGHWISWLPASS
jgi:hypothetical protein